MSNIKVTSKCTIYDGMSITFKAPCDLSDVVGLTVTDGTTTKTFTFKDALGNTLTGMENIFAQSAYIKVVLDTTNNFAYIQNGESNGYLETKLDEILKDSTKALYGMDSSAVPDDIFQILSNSIFQQGESKIAGELAIGSTVSIPIGGVSYDFIVVQQGKPSDVYDDSCDGTWLMMKDVYANRVFDDNTDGVGYNAPAAAASTQYLERLSNVIDPYIASAIKTVKVPYARGNGSSVSSVNTGSNGLSCKLFLLSGTEVGLSSSYMAVTGAKLSYFTSSTQRIAYLDGTANTWWTRSPYASRGDYVFYVTTAGGITYTSYSGSCGIRPCFVVPSDFDLGRVQSLVDGKGQSILIDGSQVISHEKYAVGSYVGTGAGSSDAPYKGQVTLMFDFEPKLLLVGCASSSTFAIITPGGGIAFSSTNYSQYNMYAVSASVSDNSITFNSYYGYLQLQQSPYGYSNYHAALSANSTTYNYVAFGV